MTTRIMLGLIVALALLFVATLSPADAAAQTPFTLTCSEPPPDMGGTVDDAIETREQRQEDAANCAALAERLERIANMLEAANESETTTAAQRVALAPVDRNRLDLMWMGSWATVGVAFGLLLAPMMSAAFRWWRE